MAIGRLGIGLVGCVAAVIVIGCSGAGSHDDHERTDRELAPMHGTLGAFHDAFAPIYHMDKGSERDARACASAGDLEGRATAVTKDLRSDKDPIFKARSQSLLGAVRDLESACSAKDGVEAKLEATHEAFHATLESAHEAGTGHDEKDESSHGHDTNQH